MKKIIIGDATFYHGDCLLLMQDIQDKSIDMILCDLPYGTTACSWDIIIPFEPLWVQYKRIIKDNGAIVLTASQPFTSKLVVSNLKDFKHEWIWTKNRGSNFASLKTNPFKEHENIVVFGKKIKFNAIRQERNISGKNRANYDFKDDGGGEAVGKITGKGKRRVINKNIRHPSSVQKFNTEVGMHPTQKPIKLFSYLIETYTNQEETVLDNCFGSGTTAIACYRTWRKFIGIEKEKKYFDIAVARYQKEIQQLRIGDMKP